MKLVSETNPSEYEPGGMLDHEAANTSYSIKNKKESDKMTDKSENKNKFGSIHGSAHNKDDNTSLPKLKIIGMHGKGLKRDGARSHRDQTKKL